MNNIAYCVPQELLDIIFMELDFSSIEKSRSLQSDYVKKCTEYITLYKSVENGNLHCLKYLFSKGQCAKYSLMDMAAENGHLEIVIWLHENRKEGCTIKAMDMAAKNGHLDVVKWLHFNRKEGCTTWAMDFAAKNGHLEVVKWLHENRTEGCTTTWSSK